MKKRLGDILLSRGVVDALQLQAALGFQRQWGMPLGQVVVDQGFCEATQVFAALAEQTGVAAVDLDSQLLDARLARLVPVKVAEAHRVVPLRLEGPREAVLVVAIAAPASLASLDVVKNVSGKRVVARLAPDPAIRRAIGRLYRGEVHTVEQPEAPEALALPEAEELLPFIDSFLAEDIHAGPGPSAPDVKAQAATLEQDGLPLFSPLELDVELEAEPSRLVPVATAVLAPSAPLARVLVYGWGTEATTGLVHVLGAAGIAARVASAAEVRAADEDAVVISPLPSMEVLGERVRARLLVAGKAPEQELTRAQRVGARGFLAAPVDPELLLRAVRRLLRPSEVPLPA
ncbi:hypothetical protein [Hyalangium rubrum]|uniref:Type II secretion system protein GspE N-terminal domain-containing protein n=1 Tax=Hyalangium rubrum TaxID=3103134 RepID=A0ABU5HCQ5_9BACT|nr:hypothetical protein [Hyalangium sp. s54d21]MDY7231243.1 hypothetical protein [Hyalangium sp. s54d21]